MVQSLLATGLLTRSGALGLLAACTHTPGDSAAEDDDLLSFAVITDAHLHADPEPPNNQVRAQTIAILNDVELPLEFVLLTGDPVDELPSDQPDW